MGEVTGCGWVVGLVATTPPDMKNRTANLLNNPAVNVVESPKFVGKLPGLSAMLMNVP